MSADNDTDNPLSVDEAMDLIGKWETHPGLLMAIFDASRKLRDEVEMLLDVRIAQQQQILEMMRIIAQHVKEKQAMQTELDQLRDEVEMLRDQNSILRDNLDALLQLSRKNAKQLIADKQALKVKLDQLRAVVAQNNQSLAQIVTRWIRPGNN